MEKFIKSGRGVSVVIATLLMVTVILAASFMVYLAMMGQIPVWQQAARPPSAASPLLIDQVVWSDENGNSRLDRGDYVGLVVINNGASLATIDSAYVADIRQTLVGAAPGACIYYITPGSGATIWVNITSPSTSVNSGKTVKIGCGSTRGDMGITYFDLSRMFNTGLTALKPGPIYLHSAEVPGMPDNPAHFMDKNMKCGCGGGNTTQVTSNGVYFYTNPLGESDLKGSPHTFEVHVYIGRGSGTVTVQMLDVYPNGYVTPITTTSSAQINGSGDYKLTVTNPEYVLHRGHRLVVWIYASSGTFTLNYDGKGQYNSRVDTSE